MFIKVTTIWPVITSVSNVKTILPPPEQKDLIAYFLVYFFSKIASVSTGNSSSKNWIIKLWFHLPGRDSRYFYVRASVIFGPRSIVFGVKSNKMLNINRRMS